MVDRSRKDCLHYMKGAVFVRIISDILAIALPTVSAYLIGNMADAMLALDMGAIMGYLPSFILSLVLVIIAAPLFMFYENVLLTRKGFDFDAFLMGRMIRKNLRAIEKTDFGEVVERLEDDSAAFCWNTVMLYSRPLVIIGYFIALFLMMRGEGGKSVYFFIVALVPMVPVLKMLLVAGKKADYRKRGYEFDGERRTVEEPVVNAAPWLRSWGMTGFFSKRLRKNYDTWMATTGMKRIRFEKRSEAFDHASSVGVPIIVLASGALLVKMGQLSVGELLAGWMMLSAVRECHIYLAELVMELKAAKPDRERIALFYGDEEDEDENRHSDDSLIKASGINFSYGDKPVLDDVSVDLEKGKSLRLDGENGSGKSTLTLILSGLYPQDSGMLEDARGVPYSMKDLRHIVTLVEQDSAIFSGTVRENLFSERYEDAEKLLKRFGFTKDLDHEVGKEGEGLSPGEKKKLVLVRALLRDSDYLILDEPLNHLDAAGTAVLEKELRSKDSGKVIITHKDMKMDFDNVLTLQKQW